MKVRGFRVEPGEIEAVLRRHPQVADCAVVAREDAPGDVRLVAYVVGSADPETLKAHLRLSLPEHMVPADFVALDALPLTTNGKLDRRALSAPEPAVASSFVAPRTEVEETIAGIWAKVLRRDQVGVHDNFLEIGGHSLLATRVVSRIRAAFGLELPLRALLEAPTLADLAVGVEALRGASPAPVAAVVRTGRTGPLPLSFAQERLWFLDRMALGSALYNLPAALRLRGALDAPALERALGEVARRHEALRTTFSEVDGSPAQSVVPFAGFALAVEDLSAAGEADREAAVQRRAAEEAARPFDLAAGPHFRARLLRLAGEEHVLLLCMHHIVSDGWSMGVLFCELWALYAAYRDGAESPLLELPVQYADYAAWQREQLQGEALDRQLAYWKDRLAGAPAVLELPTDHPHPPVQSHRGALARIDLPGAALKRLQALGRSEGATPFMVLLGAVQLLLSKYAGTDDVVVGSPIAGRTQREVEGLVGFFVNTLVLRTDLSGDPSFREVLRRVRDVTLSAYEHQAVPFEKLVEALQPERSLSHSPLFQVMVQMESGSAAAAPDGLRLDRVGFAIETTKFDLTVAFAEDERGTHGVLGYAADLFEPATAERMARHLAFLLERVADDPDLPVSRASLLGEAERARVLHEWSGTDAEGTAALVHRRFADQAARTPDAVAVTHRAGTVTYRELDARANRLARHLRRRGVSADVRVGLCLERTPEMVVAVLAVLKAGGAYVPLDPSYPAERLTFMLDDAGAALVLTQESLRSALPATAGVEILSVDGQRAAIAAEDDAPVDGGAEGRSLAYVIYTSGSTGRPKGVGVEHGGLAAYLDWACATYPGRGSAVHSSLSFDLTVTSLFVPLLGGGCVELVEEEEGVDGLAARLRDGAGYPVLKLTPAHLRFLGEQLDGRELGVGAECLVVGGEALLGEHLELWWQRLPHTLVVNEYGPTETVVGCCIHAVRAGDAGAGRVPIGRPVPGTRLYVLDAGGLPAPAGVSGELYIGGAQVARGYIGRPALTAERFLPDPFSGRPGARLYRTGDRARWTESAVLDYLGRLDEQVKVRGFRVEPGEIEAALRRHPGVADCAVITREHAPGDVRLVAYVVGTADPETLKPHLRLTLPEHMVPADVVSLDVLPLTSNGKLDRRALPAPSGGSGRGLRPETELEGRLGTLWQEVLGIAAVGVEDNFFDLGGHSLLLARLQSRLGRELGREVPLVELFRYPTVRSLARWLQGTSTDDSAATKGEERAGIRQAVLGRLATRRTRGA
ncbi:MAG TPA: amino acid adenylation domain-containing protein [Longimicrobium sp.]|nr:amino acid adenylation domain-containing protein [Longimicrobium sp.]